jgi:Tfp pilus assembly protein PilN
MKMSAAVVAAALLAGCGGSGGDPTTDKDVEAANTATATATQDASVGDTMSADAWAKRVETICVQSAAKAAEAGKKLQRRSAAAGDSEQELAHKTLALTSDLLDPWLNQIEALPKPQGCDEDVTEFITSMHDVGDLLGKTATAIKQDNQTNGKKLVKQLKAKSVSVRGQARALGIEKCNPPSA